MRTILYVTLATLATLFTACSDDNMPAGDYLKDTLIRVTAGVNDLGTRAGANTDNLTNFGLFVTNSSNMDYTYTNVYMKKGTGSAWNGYENDADGAPSKYMFWQSDTTSVTVVAYAPFQPKATATGSITDSIRTNQKSSSISSDFLYAIATVTPKSPDVSKEIYFDGTAKSLTVKLKHHMCKLRVNIKFATEAIGQAHGTLLTGTKLGYTVTLADGTVTLLDNNPASIMMAQATKSDGFDDAYEAILAPQSATYGIQITVGKRIFTYTAPQAYTFVSGNSYILDLNIGENIITTESISVSDWVTGEKIIIVNHPE